MVMNGGYAKAMGFALQFPHMDLAHGRREKVSNNKKKTHHNKFTKSFKIYTMLIYFPKLSDYRM